MDTKVQGTLEEPGLKRKEEEFEFARMGGFLYEWW